MAESLGSAVLTISIDDTQLKAGLERAKQFASSTGRSIGQALSGAGAGQSLTSLNIKLNSLQNELQNVAIGTRRFRELRDEIDKTQRSLNRAQGGGGAGVAGNLASAVAGLGAGAAATGFLRGSISAAVELESITKRLSNTLGPQGAGQALSFTKGLSDQLGLSFKTLASSFGSFTAAATAANVPLDQQKELFAAVSKAAQALGLSNDEINGSLLALQQVAAKGTVQMEELRGQLGERLPIAFSAVARGLDITQQELIKLVESGRLTASEFFPALTKGLNELTAGAGGTETAAQNFQKLGNAWDELQTTFGTSLLPTVIEQVNNLAKAVEGAGVVLRANKLGLGGGLITNALGIIPDQGAEAVGALRSLQTQFALTEKQANALFTDAVAAVGARPNAFGQLTLSAQQFSAVLESLPALAERFRAKNKDVTGELNAQNAAAARLLQEELKRRDSVENLQSSIKSLADQQKTLTVDSQEYNRISQELVNKQTRLNELKKTESQRWAEEIAAANQLKDIQEEIAIQQQRGSLTGTGVGALQSLKAFRDAQRAEQNAQAALRADPGNSSLFNASQQAAANVELAAAKTKADLQDAFKSAQDAVRSISRSIEDSVTALNAARGGAEGINRYIDPQQARDRQAAANVALFREASQLANQLGVDATFRGGLTEQNSQLTEFINAARQELRGTEDLRINYDNLAKANNDLTVVNQALININSQLAEATANLASKDWNVYVNAPATADLPRGVEVYQ